MGRRQLRDVLRRPVVVAPMAGGPSTPGLVVAVASAGVLGFLAGGYKTAAVMSAEIDAVRAATREPFGVNVFVPGTRSSDPGAVAAYLASLAPDLAAVGAQLGDSAWNDDDWDAKISVLLAAPPPVVSFTFGCPPVDLVAALQAADSLVAVTVTDPGEARLAAALGVDFLAVQGREAGAHRGRFVNDDAGQEWSVRALVGEIARATEVALVAGGGLMSARDVASVLSAGAAGAQCGTAFLRCPESGAHAVYKDALADRKFKATAVTRAFSGRPARGLVNGFMREHADAPRAYPEINGATRLMRGAAAALGDTDRMSLWAGEGYREATTRPACEIVELLTRGLEPSA
jgi:nitronate monooxygenase